MERRFILGQQALTPDGAVYQIIWDEPYNENITPDAVARALSGDAPENTVAGSTCVYNTEDADGYPVEWLFAFDGTNWALDRVVRGGSAGGGGGDGIPEVTITPTSDMSGTYTSTIPYADLRDKALRYDKSGGYPVRVLVPVAGWDVMSLGHLTNGSSGEAVVVTFNGLNFYIRGDGTVLLSDDDGGNAKIPLVTFFYDGSTYSATCDMSYANILSMNIRYDGGNGNIFPCVLSNTVKGGTYEYTSILDESDKGWLRIILSYDDVSFDIFINSDNSIMVNKRER